MSRLCADLSTSTGSPTTERQAELIADDSVGAAAPDAAGSRSAGAAPTATVAATVQALRMRSAQVCGLAAGLPPQLACLQDS